MSYDSLTPVVKFNSIAGFPKQYRSVSDPSIEAQMDFLEEEFTELQEALDDLDRNETLDACGDIIVVAAGMIHKLGVDPNHVMWAINESNASKFCETVEEAEASVKAYEGDERYQDVCYKLVEDVYVIYGRKPGIESWKILKGVGYKSPSLVLLENVAEQMTKEALCQNL